LADMGKIQPGKSTREDVLRDWEWCNAHLDTNRLFVGKVVHSKTKNIDMMGPIYMGSEGRQWDDENFDSTRISMNNRMILVVMLWANTATALYAHLQ
jgi:hypothetical protein